jgi:hypothetical protein
MTTDGTIRVRSNPIEHYEWGEAVNIGLYPNETYLMVWAALYEGEYTVETLPPYIPKGYAAELAECKRYYQVIPYTIARRASSYDETLYFDAMRVSPTATIYSHNNTVNKSSYYNGTGWTDADVTLSVSCFNYGCSIRVYHTDSVTDKAFGFNRIELSADL